MTLRVRIVAVVSIVVAAVVLVVGVSLHRSTESSLVGEIDADLLERADALRPERVANRPVSEEDLERLQEFGGFGPDLGARFRGGRTDPFGRTVGFDVLARVLDGDGVVRLVLDTEFEASTDEALLADALLEPVLSDGSSPDGDVRVVTAALPTDGFVQYARPLDEVNTVLDSLRTRTVLIGLLAIAGAGGLAWMLAGRTVRPIRDLTEATEYVAATGDLDQGVKATTSGDEVGRLSASFTSMLDALSASRRQQHQLVMDASHELRTPLTSLRTNVDVLQRGHELSSEDRDAVVADLDAELGELSDLVAELVDLATDVRSGEELAPITLTEVAEPVVERARRRTEREIAIETGRAIVLEARPEAVARAIRNLVDNAAKFSPPGAPIRVEIQGGRLTVHDQGAGVPEGERERIFDRFHRVESSRTLPGSGLGLAIVRQVAEAHGGEVFAGPSPDGGAAIGFSIPTVDG
jgi:two-component system, OmpR family, sensor histidine kinase MprB